MNRILALTLLAATAAAPAALAQDATGGATSASAPAPAPAPAVPAADRVPAEEVGNTFYVTGQSANSMFSSDLIGRAVYGTGDEKVGDVNDILITGDGEVAAVVIGVGGFLGLGEKDVAVPLSALGVSIEDGDTVLTLEATENELLSAPVFVRADGTTSDRLGAFERAYESTRRDAEALLDVAGQRAGEIADDAGELAGQAQEEAGRLVERGREAIRVLRGEDQPAEDGSAPAQ